MPIYGGVASCAAYTLPVDMKKPWVALVLGVLTLALIGLAFTPRNRTADVLSAFTKGERVTAEKVEARLGSPIWRAEYDWNTPAGAKERQRLIDLYRADMDASKARMVDGFNQLTSQGKINSHTESRAIGTIDQTVADGERDLANTLKGLRMTESWLYEGSSPRNPKKKYVVLSFIREPDGTLVFDHANEESKSAFPSGFGRILKD